MEGIYKHYIIDMSCNNNFVQIPTVQGDGNNVRGFEVELISNNVQYVIDPENTIVSIAGTKSDTKTIFNSCTVTAEGYILVDITSQMAAVAGRGDYQIVLMDKHTNSQLKSFPFYILTTSASFSANTVTSSDEFGLLVEKTAEAVVAIEETAETNRVIRENEETRSLNEETRVANENIRVVSEEERVSHEEERISAEEARITNEDQRVEDENIRLEAESIRCSSEDERVAKETIRVSNEDMRIANEEQRVEDEVTRLASETVRVNAETARIAAEDERILNEEIREESEATRIENETQRIASEETRKTKETERLSNEEIRVEAENTRIANETIRETAESQRIASETVRVSAEEERIAAESERKANEEQRVSQEQERRDFYTAAMTDVETATERANTISEDLETKVAEDYFRGIQGETGLRGSRWSSGVAITGTDAVGIVFPYSGVVGALENDYYVNTRTNDMYKCVLGGEADVAKWAYIGNIAEADMKVGLVTDKLSEWSTVDGIPNNIEATFVTFVNNKFIASCKDAVNNKYFIYVSDDGDTWYYSGEINMALSSLTYGNGIYVGISADKLDICYSIDIETWSYLDRDSSNLFNSMEDIIYTNGKFIIVGSTTVVDSETDIVTNTTEIRYSTDGITWETAEVTGEHPLCSVAYGNNMFIAVGKGGLMYVSNDGITWTNLQVINSQFDLYKIIYANKMFAVACSKGIIYYSYDGTNWSPATVKDTSSLTNLSYGNRQFIACSDNTMYYSVDCIDWSNKQIVDCTFNYLSYGEYNFIVVANNQLKSIKYIRNYVSMDKAVSDIESEISIDDTLTKKNAMADAKAVGDRLLYYQTSQKNELNDPWQHAATITANKGFAYGLNTYVAIGESEILYSTDRIIWLNAEGNYTGLNKIIFTGSGFAIAANGSILTSTDGITWTTVLTTDANLIDISIANKIAIAVGDNGCMYRSADTCATWSAITGKGWGSNNLLYVVGALGKVLESNRTYYNSVFAVSDGNNIYYSSGGTSWYQATLDGELPVKMAMNTRSSFIGFVGITNSGYCVRSYGNDFTTWTYDESALFTDGAMDCYYWEYFSNFIIYGNNKLYLSSNITLNSGSMKEMTLDDTDVYNINAIAGIGSNTIMILTDTGKIYTTSKLTNIVVTDVKDKIATLTSDVKSLNTTIKTKADKDVVDDLTDRFSVTNVTGDATWRSTSNVGNTVFGNGMFVNYQGKYSYDGITWYENDYINSIASSSYSRNSIIYGNGIFVAIIQINTDNSPFAVLYSSDGVSWSHANEEVSSLSSSYQYQIAYTKGTFMIIGHDTKTTSSKMISAESSRTVSCWSSTDGSTWTRGTDIVLSNGLTPTAGSTMRLYYFNICNFNGGNGIFYFSGGYAVQDVDLRFTYYTANKGSSWTKITQTYVLECGAYGNSKYIGFDSSYLMYVSTDTKTWTKTAYSIDGISSTTFVDQAGLHTNYTPICQWLNDRFYMIFRSTNGSIKLYESFNTTAWTEVSTSGGNLYNLSYGNDTFVWGSYRKCKTSVSESLYLDNFLGNFGVNSSEDRNPLTFTPFSFPIISKGSMSIASTSDPALFIPLEDNNMYLMLDKEVTISSGVIYGYRMNILYTSKDPTTGIGLLSKAQINGSTNTGITLTEYKREDAFGISIKPSAVTYRVDYILMKIM